MSTSILFIGKKDDFFCEQAKSFVDTHFQESSILLGSRGDNFPDEFRHWKGDYIVSYLSPWIIPEYMLDRTNEAAINFHPGPPKYPGIGCTNFALYNGEERFGVTCHHMDPKPDTGDIIATKKFNIQDSDTVYSLTQRCYAHILSLFYDIGQKILNEEELPDSEKNWKRKPYTRKELNELCEVSPEMSTEEIKRRVRAVTFPDAPGAYIEIDGMRFTYEKERSEHPIPPA